MLKGLYVFHLIEEETRPEQVQQLLGENGFACRLVQTLGEAKHVFTHRVWNMSILHFELESLPENGQMVKLEELDQLPFPTALKAAVKEARTLLAHRRNTL